MIGLYAFFYTTLHLLAFVLLWLHLNWADIGKEIAERPFITVGFAAYLILLILALTSFNQAQRKMGRYWKLLHRTVYAAAVLAVIHLIWIVRSDFGEALLYGVLVSALLAYRYFHKNFPFVRQFVIR